MAIALNPVMFYASVQLVGVVVGTMVTLVAGPLAAAVLERARDGTPLSRRWLLSLPLGMLGTALLCLAKLDHSRSEPTGPGVLGILLGIASGVTYALFSWGSHRLVHQGLPSHTVVGAVFGVGALLMMPVLLLTGTSLLESWPNVTVAAYMVIGPMFAAYLLYSRDLKSLTPTTATTLTLAELVVAPTLAVLVVGEQLPASGWIGVALILGCLMLCASSSREMRRPVRP